MALNWKEIGKVLDELSLEGCRIQGVRQPDFHSLVLELFRPGGAFGLYANLAAGSSRIHRLTRKLSYPKVTQRFAEFLRARVRGGKILAARQVPGDRLFCLAVGRAGETTLLWFRLWGAASNIIATDPDGLILDAYYRRPGRGEETGGRYCPQPDGQKPAKDFEIRPYPATAGFSDFIEAEYFRREDAEKRARLLARIERDFSTREAKIHAALAGLEKRRETYANPLQYKKAGDLLMQNLHAIKKGEPWFGARDYETGGTLEIPLEAALSPYGNAQALYQKYKKAKSGIGIVEEEIENLRRSLDRLGQRRERLLLEGDLGILEAEAGKNAPRPAEKEKNPAPGLRFESGGFCILVGRTASENDELLRRHVRGNDWWLHTRDVPGAYVFVKCLPGKSVPLDTLLDAGNLAVFYSKARAAGRAELYYTQAKHLRRAKGEKTATVLPTHEKNLSIQLDQKRLARLNEK
ncbi:MAG: NFACT family protein [Spirochaetia bacterium]|jgi:predicted ribosome quality control (RQC) complex YloA/Tae2 family protein|nr:NFACT family protein [Spirochaetia bacterium]